MKFCPQCGKPVDTNKQFCTNCGSPLNPPGIAPYSPEQASTPYYKKAAIPAMNRQTIIAIVAVVGIIIVIAIGVLFVLPALTGSGITPPSIIKILPGPATVTPRGTFVIPKETEPPAVPTSGVWVHINYIGSWKATYGMPGALQTSENSGERYYEIPGAGGQIDLVAEKLDSSTNHALFAEIVKDGISLTNGSTSEAYGKVSLSADAGAAPITLAQATAALPQIASPTLSLTTTTPQAGRTPEPVTTALICPSDTVPCKNGCKDVISDNNNCGYCGVICPTGQHCENGHCAVTCPEGLTSCANGCVNVRTDPKNCGFCGVVCPYGLTCQLSVCTKTG